MGFFPASFHLSAPQRSLFCPPLNIHSLLTDFINFKIFSFHLDCSESQGFIFRITFPPDMTDHPYASGLMGVSLPVSHRILSLVCAHLDLLLSPRNGNSSSTPLRNDVTTSCCMSQEPGWCPLRSLSYHQIPVSFCQFFLLDMTYRLVPPFYIPQDVGKSLSPVLWIMEIAS